MSSATTAAFGALLRYYRHAAGLTQQELAERAGLASRAISDLERGARTHPYRDTIRRLADALGVPDPARDELFAAARRIAASTTADPGTDASDPMRLANNVPHFAATEIHHNLPDSPSRFIGREGELAEVRRLLVGTRLLTLTGTGGCGKTRLAFHVATDLADAYPDGVWLVELAPLADPALVAGAVATALRVREGSSQPVEEVLVSALRARRLLLVLDNCEHVIVASARIADTLLRGCPGVGILATSREPLRIAGEAIWRVPSLGFPRVECALSRDAAAASEAVQLFVDRAGAVLSGFRLTESNAPTIAQICARLDGIPLAIELAAARIAVLPVEQIAARLDQRFRLLTSGSRAALPRHQTLAALVGWSYDLLTARECILFNRLAVFAGGFTLEAAEAVCSDDMEGGGPVLAGQLPSPIPRAQVLDLVSELVNKSLVVAAGNAEGVGRFALLETLRQYARERLEESGEATRIQERHAAHYLTLAADSGSHLDRFDCLEREHNNLRAALRWFLAVGEAEWALRLGTEMWGFWAMRGYLTEGRQQLATLLALPESAAPPEVRAEVLAGAGRLAFNQSDFPMARTLLEQSLACWYVAGDKRKVSWLLNALGHLHREQGDFAGARALFEESLAVSRETGSGEDMSAALNYQGLLALQEGDFSAARAFLQECLDIQREVKDDHGLTWATSRLGHVAHAQGDLVTARQLYSESLATLRQWNDRRGIASLLANLGMVDVDEGDGAAANAHFRESAELLLELRDRTGTALLLDAWAGLAAATEQPVRALRLAGAAAALREATGTRHARNLMDWLERVLTPARRSLSEEVTRAAWAEGRAMTLEQAVDYALEEAAS